MAKKVKTYRDRIQESLKPIKHFKDEEYTSHFPKEPAALMPISFPTFLINMGTILIHAACTISNTEKLSAGDYVAISDKNLLNSLAMFNIINGFISWLMDQEAKQGFETEEDHVWNEGYELLEKWNKYAEMKAKENLK